MVGIRRDLEAREARGVARHLDRGAGRVERVLVLGGDLGERRILRARMDAMVETPRDLAALPRRGR
jgi:hypothetical protein